MCIFGNHHLPPRRESRARSVVCKQKEREVNSMEVNITPSAERDSFRSKWGFILACIGSAVGMGNIWRFPIMVSQWGGITFLIPYCLFVVLIGASGVLGEFALGRMTGSGPIGAFGSCTEMRGSRKAGEIAGALPVIGSLALAIGYTVVVGWIFKYTFMGISGSLYGLGTDMDIIGGAFSSAAPDSETLAGSMTTVFSGEAGNSLWLGAGLAVSALIMILGIGRGIETANKFMMPALFVLLAALAVYISFLPGADKGYSYIFTLNPEGLKNPQLWIFAFGQAFFSLSVAGNGSVIYGSYLPKDKDLVYSAGNVALFDTAAALLAAFVIIPAMAAGGGDLSRGGPGLMFVWLVNIFNGMPGGRIVGMIFFICVLFAGVSSLINLYEAPVATLQEVFHLKRLPACLITAAAGFVTAVCIQGITSAWMDVVSIYICPLGAAIAGVMFFWVCEKEKALEAVSAGRAKPVGIWFVIIGRYIYVPLAVAALAAGAVFGGIG